MSERVKAMLAKAAVKSPGIEPHIPGGKAPLINGLDVMAAMAGITPRLAGYLCLAKYSNDDSAKSITIQLLTHSLMMAGESKRITQQDSLGIANLIVNLEVRPGLSRCPKCEGRKSVLIRGLAQPCKRCDGTGKIELAERMLAKLCKIDRDTFRNRKYKELIKEYQAKLGEWETSALYVMDYKLFGEERVAV